MPVGPNLGGTTWTGRLQWQLRAKLVTTLKLQMSGTISFHIFLLLLAWGGGGRAAQKITEMVWAHWNLCNCNHAREMLRDAEGFCTQIKAKNEPTIWPEIAQVLKCFELGGLPFFIWVLYPLWYEKCLPIQPCILHWWVRSGFSWFLCAARKQFDILPNNWFGFKSRPFLIEMTILWRDAMGCIMVPPWIHPIWWCGLQSWTSIDSIDTLTNASIVRTSGEAVNKLCSHVQFPANSFRKQNWICGWESVRRQTSGFLGNWNWNRLELIRWFQWHFLQSVYSAVFTVFTVFTVSYWKHVQSFCWPVRWWLFSVPPATLLPPPVVCEPGPWLNLTKDIVSDVWACVSCWMRG